MNKVSFLKNQINEMGKLLNTFKGSKVVQLQWKSRLESAQRELNELTRNGTYTPPEPDVLPKAAIYLSGECVSDKNGIQPSLAGNALIQYEAIYKEFALWNERQEVLDRGGLRRASGSQEPKLKFTGTLNGSFGLEFAPVNDFEHSRVNHLKTLKDIARSFASIAAVEEKKLSEVIDKIPRKVLPKIKDFFKLLSDHKAEIRFSFEDSPGKFLTLDKVNIGSQRLSMQVKYDDVEFECIFHGLTRDTGTFNAVTLTDQKIIGQVSRELPIEEVDRIAQYYMKKCILSFETTTTTKLSGEQTTKYTLTQARLVTE